MLIKTKNPIHGPIHGRVVGPIYGRIIGMIRGITYHLPVLALALSIAGAGCAHENTTRKELSATEKARMQVEIANGALVEGDPTGALQSLALAEREDSKLPELHHSKALALHAKKDIYSAIQSARKAVELRPDYSDANNTLGKLLVDVKQYDEAIKYLRLAANDRLYRDSYKAWTNLGITKYLQGEFVQAEAYFNRAVQDSPDQSCIAHHYMGHIKLKDNRLSDAIHDYDLASKRFCARYGEAQLSLGIAYEQSKHFQLARKTYIEIQKRYPNTKLAETALEHLRFLP